MKVSFSSQRKLESKIVHLEEKVKKLQLKNKNYSKSLKYQKKRVKQLEKSRDTWKTKTASKSKRIKVLNKRLKSTSKIKRHHYSLFIVTISILLRIVGGCSYRSIPKILGILNGLGILDLMKLPCANTVQNWVSKLGHYSLEASSSLLKSKEFCLILDESMNQGNERSMLMLLAPLHPIKEQSLAYQQVKVCHLSGQSSWTGDKIKSKVKELMEQEDLDIKMLLSDEDSKLLKAARLLELPHLPDINHAIASCLRRTFEKNESYKNLVKQVSSYQRKLVNQEISYLRPPKQRVKARFMNQKGFVRWAELILKNFDKLKEDEQRFFLELPEHQGILSILGKCIDLAERVLLILKTRGLSKSTIKDVEQILFQEWFFMMNFVPLRAPLEFNCLVSINSQEETSIPFRIQTGGGQQDLFGQFLKELKKYIDRYKEFLETNKGVFNVSTDIIESLFGKYKSIKASNPFVGISKIDLELPVYCLQIDQINELTKIALEATLVSNLDQFIKDNSSDNQLIKRKDFFKNGT